MSFARCQFLDQQVAASGDHRPAGLNLEQRAHGFAVWENPLTPLRFPKLYDLYQDPFERAEHESIGYGRWRAERMFALAPAQAYVAKFLSTFKEYPPRQKAASFSIDQVLETLESGGTGTN